MKPLKSVVIRLLEKVLRDVKADNTELSEAELLDIASVLCHKAMSKAVACEYLNLSRSRFDDLVREGKIPRGRKRKGFKELVWYEDELQECINYLK